MSLPSSPIGLTLAPGQHLYNYADKPDLSMNTLVTAIRRELGQSEKALRIPYFIGILGGTFFDIFCQNYAPHLSN